MILLPYTLQAQGTARGELREAQSLSLTDVYIMWATYAKMLTRSVRDESLGRSRENFLG